MYKSILERGKSEGRNLNRLTVAFTLGYMAALGKTEAHTTLTKPKVCVTGGSGFVAGHVCKVLVESGRFSEVRATTRTKSLEKTGFLERMGVNVISGCDLLKPGSFDQALHDCDFVAHCASPFQFADPDDPQKGFVDPAVNGTLNVLNSALKSKTVKRVVLTSSCAAISWGDPSKHPDGGVSHVWNEDDWQTDNTLTNKPYRYSKRLAEEAAWDFVKRHKNCFDLAVINPSFVLGPVLSTRVDAASVKYMKSLLDGSSSTTFPITFGTIDVRDVALAHMNAMFLDLEEKGVRNRHGQARFVLSSSIGPLDVAKYLRDEFDGFVIPTTQDASTKSPVRYDNTRAKKFLDIDFRPIQQQILDGARSLIAKGIVTMPTGSRKKEGL